MKRFAAPAVLGVALLAAAPAAADPDDLVPYCTSGQAPTAGECKPLPDAPVFGNAPGANPGLPMGVDPGTPSAF